MCRLVIMEGVTKELISSGSGTRLIRRGRAALASRARKEQKYESKSSKAKLLLIFHLHTYSKIKNNIFPHPEKSADQTPMTSNDLIWPLKMLQWLIKVWLVFGNSNRVVGLTIGVTESTIQEEKVIDTKTEIIQEKITLEIPEETSSIQINFEEKIEDAEEAQEYKNK